MSKIATTTIERLGATVSRVAFPGIAVGTPEHDELPDHGQAIADAAVAKAVEKGVTYFDCAPGYWDFRGMARLGPALAPYRDQVFVACKTGKRDAAGAKEELERSLKLMQTDHFDLYQLHAMSSLEDFEKVMAPGGAMEVFRQAKKDGVVKRLGFSCHSEETALALIATGEFDSILTAFNFVSWSYGGFGQAMLAAAQAAGMGVLAIKSLARCRYQEGEEKKYSSCWYAPEEDLEWQRRLYAFTLSLGVSVCVSPGTLAHFEALTDLAVEFKDQVYELTDADKQAMADRYQDGEPIFHNEPGTTKTTDVWTTAKRMQAM